MQLNLTFVVQIINFWVSYAILKNFLFKPTVKFILAKEAARVSLLENLKQNEQIVAHMHETKKKNLEDFRSYIKTNYVIHEPRLQEIQATVEYTPDQEALDQIAVEAEALMITKAGHGY